MQADKSPGTDRRGFLKKAAMVSLVAGGVTLGKLPLANSSETSTDEAIRAYWEKKQKEYEALEEAERKPFKAFDKPPKYVYKGTDSIDSKGTFYAPLMEECAHLPKFQSIFTEGTAAQYFKYTLNFGMKDIIRFHGHSVRGPVLHRSHLPSDL